MMNHNTISFEYFGLVIPKEKTANLNCFGNAYDINVRECINCSVANECKKETISKKGGNKYES